MKRNAEFKYHMDESIDDHPEDIDSKIRNSPKRKAKNGAFSPHTDSSGTYCVHKCKDHKWHGSLLSIMGKADSWHFCSRYDMPLEDDKRKDRLFRLLSYRCTQCIRDYGSNPITRRQK